MAKSAVVRGKIRFPAKTRQNPELTVTLSKIGMPSQRNSVFSPHCSNQNQKQCQAQHDQEGCGRKACPVGRDRTSPAPIRWSMMRPEMNVADTPQLRKNVALYTANQRPRFSGVQGGGKNDAALPEAPAWISPAVPVVKQPSDQGTYDPAHTKVWNNTLRITGSIFYLTYWKFHRIVTTVQYNVITSLRGLHVHCNS